MTCQTRRDHAQCAPTLGLTPSLAAACSSPGEKEMSVSSQAQRQTRESTGRDLSSDAAHDQSKRWPKSAEVNRQNILRPHKLSMIARDITGTCPCKMARERRILSIGQISISRSQRIRRDARIRWMRLSFQSLRARMPNICDPSNCPLFSWQKQAPWLYELPTNRLPGFPDIRCSVSLSSSRTRSINSSTSFLVAVA